MEQTTAGQMTSYHDFLREKDPFPSEKEIIGGNASILSVGDEKILGEIIKQSLSNQGA